MRDALLTSALHRFARDGVDATALDVIRREAGASVGSLYHAFPGGKADLTRALYVETLAGYQDAFLTALGRAGGARDGVRGIVDFHLRWHGRHHDAARFLHTAREPELRAATDAPLRARNAAFFGAVRDWLAPHIAEGRIRDLPIPVLHAVWLGPAQQLCRLWLSGTIARPDPATRALLGDSAWLALRDNDTDEGETR